MRSLSASPERVGEQREASKPQDATKHLADIPVSKSQPKQADNTNAKKNAQIVLPHGIDPETERIQKQKVAELQQKQVEYS